MNDMNPNNELINTENNDKPKSSGGRKKLVIIIAIILSLSMCLAGGLATTSYITNIIRQNSTESVLMSSLQNTLELEQMKFNASLDKPTTENVGGYPENSRVDGAYKKDAGLSANAVSTMSTNGIKVSRESQWVINSPDHAYGNLSLFTTEVDPNGPYANIPEANNSTKDATWTKYSTKSLNLVRHLYGIQLCTLMVFYDMQSHPLVFQDEISQLAKLLKIQKTASASGTDTFVITIPQSNYDTLDKLYTKSKLHSKLSGCDQESSVTKEKSSVSDVLKSINITAKVNTDKKLVSSLSVKRKDILDFNVTFTPANDVSISLPKSPVEYKAIDNFKFTPK